MASLNPFEETATEDVSPIVPTSYNDMSASPPRNIEMIPMAMNPVTGHSYVQAPINNATSSQGLYPRLFIPGETVEPSAPRLPSSHLPRHQLYPTWSGASGGYHSLPRTHASSRLETGTKPIRANRTKFDGDLLGIITNAASSNANPESNRVESHKERYNKRIDQAKNELNNYFADLHQKLQVHHEKLLEGMDRRYIHNVSLIEKKELEINDLENTETVLLQNKGNSFEKLKETLSEQKRSLEKEIIPLTEMKVTYKPELLDDVINNVVTIAPAPDTTIGSKPRSKSQNGSCPVEEQWQGRETGAPESQVHLTQSKMDNGNATNRTTGLGPISYNVGMGALLDQVQDPAGIVIDKHQDNLIYVADKERHRIQIYDRSGRHLKSITKGEKMRHPHSLAVSNEFLFVLCAGKQEEKQCLLRFDKKTGAFWNGIRLNDIRHTPISVYQENIYVPTYTGIIEVFSVGLKSCRKIEITLEKKNSMSIFSSGPEIRDICVNASGIYLLVSNSENWIQVFNMDGKIINTLAPDGCLTDAHHFTVDNRGTVLVTEGKDGKIKIFKPGDKNIAAIGNAEMGGEMERIASPRGIAVDSHGKVVLCCAQNEWLLKEC